MKKHLRIKLFVAACLAGFIGQVGAFGQSTNSVWTLNAISTLKAGKTDDVETNPATVVFLSDGTLSLTLGINTFSGTYTNTTKKLELGGALAGSLYTNSVAFLESQVPPEITITVKSAKFTSKLSLKDGVPQKSTDSISGKGSETIDGKTKSKGFSFKTLLTDWTLSSGTVF